MGWFKKKGDKLSGDIDALVKNTEKQISEATTIKQLNESIEDLNDKITELILLKAELEEHAANLTIVQGELAKIAAEVKEIKEGKTKRSKRYLDRLHERISELKSNEKDLKKRIQENIDENLKIEDIEKHIKKLERTARKAESKRLRLLEKMSDQIGEVTDKAIEKIDEDIQAIVDAMERGEEPK